MFKAGSKVLVVVAAVTAAGVAGFVDGDITISADNGATVEKIDGTSAQVTLAAGTTTISAAATADGNTISGSASAEAGEAATVLNLTVTAA